MKYICMEHMKKGHYGIRMTQFRSPLLCVWMVEAKGEEKIGEGIYVQWISAPSNGEGKMDEFKWRMEI